MHLHIRYFVIKQTLTLVWAFQRVDHIQKKTDSVENFADLCSKKESIYIIYLSTLLVDWHSMEKKIIKYLLRLSCLSSVVALFLFVRFISLSGKFSSLF